MSFGGRQILNTDGTTVPDDVGFGPAVSRRCGDFVGRRSLSLAEKVRSGRLQLVGLRRVGDSRAFRAGALQISGSGNTRSRPSLVYLTFAAFSPTMQVYLGLGLLENGRPQKGSSVQVIESGNISTGRGRISLPL